MNQTHNIKGTLIPFTLLCNVKRLHQAMRLGLTRLSCFARLACVSVSLLATSSLANAQDVELDSIAAVVNEGVVLSSQLAAEALFLRQQAQTNSQTLPADDVFQERVLERLIDKEIQRQHATRRGIVIDASAVNQAVDQVARGNNMTRQQFRQTLQSQGISYDAFRDNIEHELLITQLIQRDVEARIRISQQEIDDFISAESKDEANKRYRIQHILIAVAPSAPEDQVAAAQGRAQAVLAKLNAGEDFAKVATSDSDGARALEGGDLGWRALQEVPDFLADALRQMEVGQVSEPLRSQNGLHIVRLANTDNGQQQISTETLARHIFINGTNPDGQAQLIDIRARIENGESFEALAEEFSDDPNSASSGGELPWFGPGQLPPEFDQLSNRLEPGVLSEPFRTQFGWHIMEVLDRRSRDNTQALARQQAEQALRARKIEQETTRWIRQLRDESFIDVRS